MTARTNSIWSHWKPLDEPSRSDESAAYRIRLVCAGTPAAIPRLLGSDQSGILALGESERFDRRRRQFCRALRCGDGHSEGNLLWWLELHTAFRRRYPEAAYEYCIRGAASKVEAKRLESQLMQEYVRSFGEVPPRNSAMPGRIQWIADKRASLGQIDHAPLIERL